MKKQSPLSKLILSIQALILYTLVNVLISFCVSTVVFFQILMLCHTTKEVAIAIAILVAIAVHLYIRFNHKILVSYIK